jgi:gliding motility-associated-like protein
VLKAKPTAGFGYTNTCGSLQANITSAANITAGSIALQQYYVGNTLVGTGASLSYSFAAYGSYQVKHVVRSNFGCVSDTVTQTVVVKAKPTLNLTTARDSVCANTNYTITANANVNASTITNYTWLRNNTVLPITNNQLTDNQLTNTYIYKAITTAANGCKSDTAYKTITVASKPTTTLNATNICGSKTINITASANVVNDNITVHYISYGDGITSAINPSNTTYSYTNYGTYTLKYVAKGSVGCVGDTAFFTITVKDKPSLSIAYNNDACNNKNFILSATAVVNASTITNYTWLKDGIVLPTSTNNLTQNNVAGSYVYKLIATAATGCASDTAIQNVTVEKFNTTLFTAADGCLGKPITITNNSINNNTQGAIVYSWQTSSGQISNAVIPNFSFATSGTKTIQLKTNTQNNCADSLSKTITVEDFPLADFNITEACLGKKINIVNNSTGAISAYNWQTSNGQTDNNILPNFIFNTVGNYNIKLQVATANNCTAVKDKNINIQAVQLFTTPAMDTNVVAGQPVQLGVIGASLYSWQWAIGSLQNANNPSPIFTASTAGIYPIQVEGTTAQGCKGTANIKINVFIANNYVWIPNAFSPNADGLNDRLGLACSGLQLLTNFTLYNRYGETVYQQSTCNAKGWDGVFKGKEQPMGAFVYVWSGVDFKGKQVSGKGTVMLVR